MDHSSPIPAPSSNSRSVGASARRKAAASRRAARDVGASGGTPSSTMRGVASPGGESESEIVFTPDKSSNGTTAIGLKYGSSFGENSYDNSMNYDNSYANRRKKKMPPPPSHFSSYLHFQKSNLTCLLVFTSCYALVLICCWPMISHISTSNYSESSKDNASSQMKRGESFQNIRGRKTFLKASHAVSDKLGTLKHRAVEWEKKAQEKVESVENDLGIELGNTIGKKDAMRASRILEEAVKEFESHNEQNAENNKGNKGDDTQAAIDAWYKANAQPQSKNQWNHKSNKGSKVLDGFMVLGMHRSGTSLLSGLLVKGFNYETGGPLIQPGFDNEKGFYERIDVVLQNDEFFQAQQMSYGVNVFNYDPEKALQHKLQGKVTFQEGERALQFLNGRHDAPYLQKDPRMCIALPTWLKLLDVQPAILFTYRHPLEVALSLKKREDFKLEHGLRLWIVYNMRAIQNSAGLCRVFSTNEAVLKDPMTEVQRISDELTSKCHVKPPPNRQLSKSVVDEFVDPNLQHNKKQREAEEKNKQKEVWEDFGNGCVAHSIESDYGENTANAKSERAMYLMAMSVFCDFESGVAYEDDYEWPDLVAMKRPARIS